MLNNESTLQEDLVIYFNLDNRHVPTTQDIPNTLTHSSGTSVMFTPFNYSDRDISGRHGSSVSVDNLMFENMASEPEMRQQIGFSNWLVGRMAYVLAQLVPRRRYSVSHFEVRFLALSVPSTSWIINSLSFEFEG